MSIKTAAKKTLTAAMNNKVARPVLVTVATPVLLVAYPVMLVRAYNED